VLVDDELDPAELRALIGRGDALVSSRFHAMISGLASRTPTLVLGWSHKYAEVLRSFELEWCSVDYSEISGSTLARRLADLVDRSDEVRGLIDRHLPDVQQSSALNLRAIDAAIEGHPVAGGSPGVVQP
jgi:colanic acid/amylovoran biosynthesis protein